MIIEQHAVYSCEWDHDRLGRIDILRGLDPQQQVFSPELYSKFKYGSMAARRHFAMDIHRALKCIFHDDLERDSASIVMTSSAYKFMPTASTALLADVLSLVNHDRRRRNIPMVEDIKIHRRSVLNTDYALMNKESRIDAMDSTQLDIDTSNLRGKHLVVLDDCIITGAHLNNISRHLRNSGVARITYLVIVSVNSNGHDQSTTSAEDYLNHNYVNSLDRWLEVTNAPDGGPLSARSLKYFLTSGESRDEKLGVLARLRREALLEMHHGAIADEIASSFKDQMEDIERQLTANENERRDCVARKVSDADDGDAYAVEGDLVYHHVRVDNDADAKGGIEEDVIDARDELSSKRGHLPPSPPPPMSRPTIQRSKSSHINRSIRDLRVLGLRRQMSESF
ncbi:hypothetical protein ACHAXA_007116 [Cyclostephanos tholiformis]|uniref:Phosphoribosyltransferase domain-containing protein n=1 Tax=Cyclostephanos tholiformis TaxID=382380 RepID=A0ABD3RYH4_9STRA